MRSRSSTAMRSSTCSSRRWRWSSARRRRCRPPTWTVYLDGASTYEAILAAIAGARHHVHLEYYIWEPDTIGTQLRDLLIERAPRGPRGADARRRHRVEQPVAAVPRAAARGGRRGRVVQPGPPPLAAAPPSRLPHPPQDRRVRRPRRVHRRHEHHRPAQREALAGVLARHAPADRRRGGVAAAADLHRGLVLRDRRAVPRRRRDVPEPVARRRPPRADRRLGPRLRRLRDPQGAVHRDQPVDRAAVADHAVLRARRGAARWR